MMIENSELTLKEEQLIRELTKTIAEINSNNADIRDVIFIGLASYVEGIKVGIKFPNQINVQKMTLNSFS